MAARPARREPGPHRRHRGLKVHQVLAMKPTNGAPFMAESRLRPRYAETDAQGVVYHTNYIIWFEVARGDYCRAVGFPYIEIEQDGYGFMVTDLQVKYFSPARYDDQIIVKVWLEKTGRASCIFGYQIYNETT